MNIFKRVFGKRKWETIYTCSCKAWRGGLFNANIQINARIIVEYEKDFNKVRCYMTDGDLIQNLDIKFLAYEIPELKQILQKRNFDI